MSEEEILNYKAQFSKPLDGISFLNTYYDPRDDATYEINTQHMRDMIDLLKLHSVTGDKLLEIGSGPLIMNSLICSNFFKEIYPSDYNCGMIEPLEKWMKGKQLEFENSYMVNYLANYVGISPNILEKQTRERFKKILKCDIHSKTILENEMKFDAVVTRFCVDSCSPNMECYNEAIKNISSLIQQNGYFIQMGFYDNNNKMTKGFWNIESMRIEDLRLTKQEVLDAVAMASLNVIDWRERLYCESCEENFKNTSSYTLLAQKY